MIDFIVHSIVDAAAASRCQSNLICHAAPLKTKRVTLNAMYHRCYIVTDAAYKELSCKHKHVLPAFFGERAVGFGCR